MLAEHGQMARDYPDVRANTVASFALGDYEWILAFEADELHRIVDLMRHLRGSRGPAARPRGDPVLHRPPPAGRRPRRRPRLGHDHGRGDISAGSINDRRVFAPVHRRALRPRAARARRPLGSATGPAEVRRTWCCRSGWAAGSAPSSAALWPAQSRRRAGCHPARRRGSCWPTAGATSSRPSRASRRPTSRRASGSRRRCCGCCRGRLPPRARGDLRRRRLGRDPARGQSRAPAQPVRPRGDVGRARRGARADRHPDAGPVPAPRRRRRRHGAPVALGDRRGRPVVRGKLPHWWRQEEPKLLRRLESLPERVPPESWCHFDVRDDNLLQRPDGSIVIIDWGMARSGPRGWTRCCSTCTTSTTPRFDERVARCRRTASPRTRAARRPYGLPAVPGHLVRRSLPTAHPGGLPRLMAHRRAESHRLLVGAARRLSYR